MEQEAKTIEEVAKTIGKTVDAGREIGGFLSRFIKGPLEQAFGIVEDKLKYMRWERQQRLMIRADDFLKQVGLEDPTRAVPLKIAIPLMQAASLEEDDALQDLWAKLLVNAGDAERGIEVRRTYISILEDLGSLEAQILQQIYSLPPEDTVKGVWTKNFPAEVILTKPAGEDLLPPLDVQVALENLIRLRCLAPTVGWGGMDIIAQVYTTPLGRSFVDACTLRPG